MTILAIDTSNHTLGIALVKGSTVIGESITYLKKNHSVRAMPTVEALMKECGVAPSELSKIVVAKGPGSYTGVRIGVTIAKTLAWTLSIPISAVSSLETLAANGQYFDGWISPLFDARRGQVYTGLYTFEEGKIKEIKPDQNILLTDWLHELKQTGKPVLFLGQDVHLHEESIRSILGETAVIAEGAFQNPRPSMLAFLGTDRPAEDVHQLVPNYIRLAEAEVKWLEGQK
ncbi:tRNA (adenosine(37)-N6)-threonylcarbamoyltransferase complex dimerization subunit type 1 TsaB [Bacillus sp. LNXM12-2]|uniref:tRNA (adenosine(37)-N6)-threonylcarbamoyltransferase complex dimerization subunit type 1 TsaB n=1 Tax=unclassified Bacillus (in: firmicutes) TaxID=185979 RepID=UPI000D02CF77|nr:MULTISPECIES: tRNA (adenosine(37)-N6)-threonylcarbamoyltransferase complex dimerization subunit type 1 TsaB [unclassified Bacillus (in: firmicutes)]PRS57428.1 tRNA (adenosine(37)-N6)-threonylcarbamoyltransferase complex dimerization subunit type 1 TsaB [Bacillus sp. GBSW19]PRS66849.1 tRNA (adenosine(37)-N6)-threonylcarbamoyltransferase complex dimerization subunit type 1 TsaB [Bacillus sp. NMTD17]PSB69009.1 tRNA (adenosine(37)-N6)-threonylcarbamoyltransferase complex dimerization subunit type